MTQETSKASAPLRDRLNDALSDAEAVDPHSVEAATLRLVQCAVRDRDASTRATGDAGACPDKAVLTLLHVMADQRRQAIQRLDDAGRVDEAEREREELAVIERFLPQPLEGDALDNAVRDVVEALDASKLKDLGRCVAALKSRYPGRIDPGVAGRAVRRALG